MLSFAATTLVILTAGRHEIISMLAQANRDYHGEFWQFGIGLTWLIGLPCWLLGVNLAARIDSQQQAVSTKIIIMMRLAIITLTIGAQILRFHYYISYIISLTILAVPVAKWLESEIIYYKSRVPFAFLERWGKFSYSLYLCHPIIIAILTLTLPLNNYTYLLYLLICVACSYGFYLILEKPAHLLAEKLGARFKKPA